ncbi:hypothetical protein LCGC14_0975470 [marine sediment metagenome]|uniref:THIF-type NAD/FAD binding fold domain-containing protein n=1 Tax=marine sediment metagenome TaxID=412755 RepID=A0A0F9RGT7_9ZZZZ
MDFTNDQVERYSRHIILPEVGGEGQQKIMEGKVLVLGAGGLGSPVALYLAAAGVGTLGIVDNDEVDVTNLQRQILHFTEDVGRAKTDSATEKLKNLNPEIKINAHNMRVTSDNINDLIKDYDIIVDGTDNFPTRFLVNDACYFAKKKLVHGAILRFDGQVMTILPDEGPCYRCIYREPPPEGLVPSCSQAGVIGTVAGIVGTIQANEVIKILIEKGTPLSGRLLVIDALEANFRKIKTKKDPRCPICSENPTITELMEYEDYC